jgi:hypothetical protein
MRRWITTIALVALASAPMRADVRVTSSTTVDGAMAAMMGGVMPSMVMHIKGTKARTDIAIGTQTMSTIVDVETKHVILLNSAEKTAHVLSADSMPAVPEGFVMPKIDGSLKVTGQSKLIAGVRCEEHAITLSLSMAEMAASPKMPAGVAEMMKDLRISMDGSLWVAKSGPGVAEYVAFQAASTKQSMGTMMRALPGMGSGGLDRLMESFAGAAGLPYLTEMKMSIQGGGEMAAMMKQVGDMKMINRVTDVSTAPVADDLFTVPADYKVVK